MLEVTPLIYALGTGGKLELVYSGRTLNLASCQRIADRVKEDRIAICRQQSYPLIDNTRNGRSRPNLQKE